MRKMMIMLFTLAMTLPMAAQEDTDMGLWMTAGAQKKINKLWSVTGEAEYRLRDDFSASDRWTIGLSTTYKPYKWLKLHAGYKFMRDNNEEEYSYHKDGSVNKYTPSYWNTKHRLYAGATGTLKMNNWNLSLRERWQYTLKRPTTVQRYDEDDEAWEDKEKKGGGKNVLRSRLQLSYDFKSAGIEPFVSAELYNQKGGLQKIRYTAGTSWAFSKNHSLEMFYRYIDDKDEDNDNRHIIGIGYMYKF